MMEPKISEYFFNLDTLYSQEEIESANLYKRFSQLQLLSPNSPPIDCKTDSWNFKSFFLQITKNSIISFTGIPEYWVPIMKKFVISEIADKKTIGEIKCSAEMAKDLFHDTFVISNVETFGTFLSQEALLSILEDPKLPFMDRYRLYNATLRILKFFTNQYAMRIKIDVPALRIRFREICTLSEEEFNHRMFFTSEDWAFFRYCIIDQMIESQIQAQSLLSEEDKNNE